jgi:hypothetical protein
MLLGVDGSGDAPSSVGAGFDALGVFGREAAVAAPDLQLSSTHETLPATPADGSVEGGEVIASAQAPAAEATATAFPVRPWAAETPIVSDTLLVSDEGEFAGVPTLPVTTLATGGLATEFAPNNIGTGATPPLLQSEPQRSRFMMPRVAVHTDGSKAYVVVRAGSLDGESYLRLRRRIGAVLSEYGLDVAEFVIDGAVVGSTLDTDTGGAHGYFKR